MQNQGDSPASSKTIIASIVTILMIVLLTCLTYTKTPDRIEISKDAREYVTASYYLWTKGMISQDGVNPSQFREPLPIMILAANMALFTDIPPGLDNLDIICKSSHYIKQINAVNIFYIFLAFLVMWRLGWQTMRSHRMAILFIFVAWTVFYIQPWYLRRPLPEYCSSLLIMLVSSIALDLLQAQNKKNAIFLSFLTGLCIGLLALTKAAVFYIALIYMPLLAIIYFSSNRTHKKQVIIMLGTMFLGFTMLTAPWIIRNKNVHLYQAENPTQTSDKVNPGLISSRGGAILLGRVLINEKIAVDPLGAAYTFSPPYIQQHLFEAFWGFKVKDLWEDGKYEDLNRNVQFKRSQNDTALNAIHEEKDSENTQTAMQRILQKPDQHLITTAVLIWRGIWSFDGGNHLKPGGNSVFSLAINLFCFVCFLLMPLVSLLQKNISLFVVTLLPTAVFWFYALVSHLIPHYTAQLIPMAVLSGLITLQTSYHCIVKGKKNHEAGDTNPLL